MALPTLYKQWKVAKYPTVDFKPFETFHLETGVPLEKTRERQILIKTTHFSNDPAQRTWVTDKPENRHYTMPVRVGETMNSMTTGLVLESRHPDYESGDVVAGHWGWREYAVIDPDKSTGIARPRQLIKEIGPADDMALGLTVRSSLSKFVLLRLHSSTS
jgi:NADPH-dependent curcumin reductase CurA